MAVGTKGYILYEQWTCKYITGVIFSGCEPEPLSPVVYEAEVCIGKEKYSVSGDTITLSRYEDFGCTILSHQFTYTNGKCEFGRYDIYKGPAVQMFRSLKADCSAVNPVYGSGQQIIPDQCNQNGAIYSCSSNYKTISKTSFKEPSCATKIGKITREHGKCDCVENCPAMTTTTPPPTKPPNKEVLKVAAELVTGLLVLFWILGFCCFCGLLWAIYFCCCGGRNGRGRTLSITARQPGQSYIKFVPDAVVEGAETGDSSYVEMK